MEKETLLDWYRQMVRIRLFEQACSELYQRGEVGGFLHLYIGQEAVAVGSIGALEERDHVITAYRDHGHALAVGIPANEAMAELTGRSTGIVGGRGGSMHLADPDRHYWGGHAVVGAHLSLATGLAVAEQYKETGGVVLCYFGDGATNIGYFHESLNLSGVWKLPVVWICENNEYGMGTTIERASSAVRMIDKAKGYKIPARRVDGNNILEVYKETGKAIKAARTKGPQFLEMMTYRFEGHSMGDPLRYRSKEEVEERKARDPITFLVSHLTENKLVGEKELDEIDSEIAAEIEAAKEFAINSPLPSLDTLYDHIYVEQ